VSGQAIDCFRAPGFSMVRECFWAYEILAELGFRSDISIVPRRETTAAWRASLRTPSC